MQRKANHITNAGSILKNKLKCVAKKMIIVIFKNKANIRRNRTNLNSQQVKQSEKHVGLRSEEHRESVP